MKIVGVDIGGTTIKLGLFKKDGHMLKFKEYDTVSNLGKEYFMEKLIEKIMEFGEINAIGISTAGQVDRHNGFIVQESPNIPGTSGLQLKSILENYFHVPVAVENDVHAAALGEKHFGIAKDLADFLFVTYGTGIGGAIVIDSQIYGGRSGFAAEFGHTTVHGNGKRCNCGLKGCYEAYASTSALIKEAKKVNPLYNDGKVIMEKYIQNDAELTEIVENWMGEIVIGLSSIIHVFNPKKILIGGGIMEQEILINKISQKVNEQIIESFRYVEIVKASLGNRAGMLGAVSLHI